MSQFDITQLLNGNWYATDGRITVGADVPCIMRKRRGLNPGTGASAQMLYVRLPDGNTVYIRPFPDGTISVQVTNREVYF